MHENLLNALHACQQGLAKICLCAKSSVYWNNISRDIESFIAKCPTSQECLRLQQKELLVCKHIPSHSRHLFSADFLLGDNYAKMHYDAHAGRELPTLYNEQSGHLQNYNPSIVEKCPT